MTYCKYSQQNQRYVYFKIFQFCLDTDLSISSDDVSEYDVEMYTISLYNMVIWTMYFIWYMVCNKVFSTEVYMDMEDSEDILVLYVGDVA